MPIRPHIHNRHTRPARPRVHELVHIRPRFLFVASGNEPGQPEEEDKDGDPDDDDLRGAAAARGVGGEVFAGHFGGV